MKTVHEYIKEYGKYTFLEKEFNEVDNVIFSLLSYIDFIGIVPGINQGKEYAKTEYNDPFKRSK